MDLKIKDVAELLNVSETTIRRWLHDGKIPAYKLNKTFRFSRIEIENWMMKRKLHLNEEERDFLPTHTGEEEQIFPLKEPANQHFSLYRALTRGGVFTDITGDTKEEVIQNTAPRIAEKLRLDADVLCELLLDREALMPTAFNNGIAVPHARECLEKVPFDLVTAVFLEKPIEYGALDEKPVNILFFLFASGDKIHLHLLAKIAHLSSNDEAVQFLRSRPDSSTVLEYIRSWESALRT